jgi:non-specific serine/threonine protein kinase
MNRARDARFFKDVDIVLTTYGTLRADAPFLKDRTFDCVILDEAQSIKNAQSVTAKAARVLKGEQRIALSGTPIENASFGASWSSSIPVSWAAHLSFVAPWRREPA